MPPWVGQHVDDGLFQRHAGQVHRLNSRTTVFTSRCILGGLPSSTSMGMSTGSSVVGRGSGVVQHQLALFGGGADHGKRAALALAESFELRQRLGRNRQHVALLDPLLQISLGACPTLRAARRAGQSARHGPRRWSARGRRWTNRPRPRRGWPGMGLLLPCAQQWLMTSCARRSISGCRAAPSQSPARPHWCRWPWSWQRCRPCRCACRGRPAG